MKRTVVVVQEYYFSGTLEQHRPKKGIPLLTGVIKKLLTIFTITPYGTST